MCCSPIDADNAASHPLLLGAAARAWSAIGVESDLILPQFSIPEIAYEIAYNMADFF